MSRKTFFYIPNAEEQLLRITAVTATKTLAKMEGSNWARIEDGQLLCTPHKAGLDDTLAFTVNFKIEGGFRHNFIRDVWEKAYDEHDAGLLMIYWAELLRNRPVLSKPVKSDKFKRRGIFFWTRNPEIPHRVWMTVATEFETVLYPKTEVEAQDMLFTVTRTFELPAKTLGPGRHEMSAKVKAHWGRHIFTEQGTISGKTSPVTIEVGKR